MKAYTGKEMAKMKALFEKLQAQGIITEGEEGKVRFAKSHAFKDANEAASFLLHRGGDNSSAWHTEKKHTDAKQKPAGEKHAPAVQKQRPAEKKHEPVAPKQKPVEKKKQHPSQPKQAKKPVQHKPVKNDAKPKEKKQNSNHQKSASAVKGKSSKRKDPRNPRGIRPQGNDAVKAAQKAAATGGYVRFAGMGQSVKVKH